MEETFIRNRKITPRYGVKLMYIAMSYSYILLAI